MIGLGIFIAAIAVAAFVIGCLIGYDAGWTKGFYDYKRARRSHDDHP